MGSINFSHPRIPSSPTGKSFSFVTALSGDNISTPEVGIVSLALLTFKAEFEGSTAVLGREKS